MPARKIRVEVFDGEGNRYTVAFEGHVTREKALRLLDLVELLGGMPSGGNPRMNVASNELSKFDKVRAIVQRHFPVVWFSSREVQSIYERELKEPITLSTVATYLARLANKGLLVRVRASNHLKYKMTLHSPEAALKPRIP